MKKIIKQLLSCILIIVLATGTLGAATAKASDDKNRISKTDMAASTANGIESMSVGKKINKAKEYPYADLEEPATVEGFEYNLKDNVEFLPDNADYNLSSAPVDPKIFENGATVSQALPSSSGQKYYQPGTNLMKFKDSSFVPKKNKIYIDGTQQGSYKVIDNATVSGGKVEAPVVSPRANEVFDSLYIPRQDIELTKGNITDLADGVTLVDSSTQISSYATGGENALPPADTSRKYHEFSIPSMVLYEYPGGDNKTEKPKGKDEDDVPTPSPEYQDPKDTNTNGSLAIKIQLKGGNIRIYEPTMVAELGWDGNFDLGFRSMKVESSVTLQGDITFNKEACIRIYGYGVDFGSGDISAHLGIGIYAVFGMNGKISITAKIEQAGTVSGGATGNLWEVALGVPAAKQYIDYNSQRFDVTVNLNAKIHAWAYVGPQVTIDVLDFNLLTIQVWVGVEGDAVISAQASTTEANSFQMDLSLDFVVLFKAWIFDYAFEKYFLRLNIYKNSFSYKEGQSVGAEGGTGRKEIAPVIKLDGVSAYYDNVWGSLLYEDSGHNYKPVSNVAFKISVTRNGVKTDYDAQTGSDGSFNKTIPGGLLPTDDVMVKVNFLAKENGQTILYRNALQEPVKPNIPFKIYILEADGFNDEVVGNVSAAAACPGHPNEEYYDDDITVVILDENGKQIRSKKASLVDGQFVAKFDNTMDLSGGHKAYAKLVFEGTTIESEEKEADLAALKLNVACTADDVDAADISEVLMNRENKVPTVGILVKSIETAGTVTNLKYNKPYTGKIEISVPRMGTSYVKNMPLNITALGGDANTQSNDIDESDLLMTRVGTFEHNIGADVLGVDGSIVGGIFFTIEHEGMFKEVEFPFAKKDSEVINAVNTNPVGHILTDVIYSRINPSEVTFTIGSSVMNVNGVMRAIDNGANTSIIQVGGVLYVPARAAVEALGGAFSFNSKSKNISINLNSKTIQAVSGKTGMKSGGNSSNMPAAPFTTEDGTVMIPVTVLSDSLGYKTIWDAESNTLTIRKPSAGGSSQTVNNTPWTGVWDTSFGTMLLTQNGSKVSGTYGEDGNTCKISGTVSGTKLTGSFTEGTDKGKFEFIYDKDGTFTGKYQYSSSKKSEPWQEWKGTRISTDFGTAKTAWGGVWETDLGTIVFNQKGNNVNGVYDQNLYQISGTVSGTKLTGKFIEGKDEGKFVITVGKNKKSFKGKLCYNGDEWQNFTGTKLK